MVNARVGLYRPDGKVHLMVQVTRGKRHVLDWTNATFKSVLSKVLDARDREGLKENAPFLFIVPEGRTTVPVEKGQPHPRVDVYVVVLDDVFQAVNMLTFDVLYIRS